MWVVFFNITSFSSMQSHAHKRNFILQGDRIHATMKRALVYKFQNEINEEQSVLYLGNMLMS